MTKTTKYLLPLFKGTELQSPIIAVKDLIENTYIGINEIKSPRIVILLRASEELQDFLEICRNSIFYISEEEIGDFEYHLISLALPNEFYDSFYNFTEGKYSKMFTPSEINYFFKNEKTKKILNKSKDLKEELEIQLGVILSDEAELDSFDINKELYHREV